MSIIGILSALLYPVIGNAMRSSKSSACASNLAQIYKASVLYMGDYDNRFPYAKDCTDDITRGWSTSAKQQLDKMKTLNVVLDTYLHAPNTFQCPLDDGQKTYEPQFPLRLSTSPSTFATCGSSYEYHTAVALASITDSHLRNSSKVNLLSDLAGHWHVGEAALEPLQPMIDATEKMKDFKYNVLFCDGHVKLCRHDQKEGAWHEG